MLTKYDKQQKQQTNRHVKQKIFLDVLLSDVIVFLLGEAKSAPNHAPRGAA